jgi:hypothetical protein
MVRGKSKSKGGRPPGKTLVRQLQVMVSDDLDDRLNEWRRNQPDLPTRAEAARRLIELGLTVSRRASK